MVANSPSAIGDHLKGWTLENGGVGCRAFRHQNTSYGRLQRTRTQHTFVEVTGAGLLKSTDSLFRPPHLQPIGIRNGLSRVIGMVRWLGIERRGLGRSPSLSYSNSYRSWRISRLDGHLAYEITCDDALPPTDRQWNVYKKGIAPAPKVVLHHSDPRLPCPQPNVIFVLGGPGR